MFDLQHPQYFDIIVILFIAVLLTLARQNLQKFFYQFAKERNIDEPGKFSESSWKTIYYVTAEIWGLYLIYVLDLFPKTINCWIGVPNQENGALFHLYYLYQLGFYVHSTYCHFTLEVKRQDFWPLFFHHIITIGLIYFSLALSYTRIGLLVLVCHDAGDIPLECGKIAVYMKSPAQNFWYIMLVITWLATRLSIFPFYIIYSAYWDAIEVVKVPTYHIQFNVGLVFLQILHIYWFGLILRIGYRVLKGNQVEDIRENEKED